MITGLRNQGYYTKHKPENKLDVVVVEASAITEEGGIVPGASVGASPELIQMADKVCILPESIVHCGKLSWLCLDLFRIGPENANLKYGCADHYRSQYCHAVLRRFTRHNDDGPPTSTEAIPDYGTGGSHRDALHSNGP